MSYDQPDEMTIRRRVVKGWAFRDHTKQEVAAIRRYLDSGRVDDLPESYRPSDRAVRCGLIHPKLDNEAECPVCFWQRPSVDDEHNERIKRETEQAIVAHPNTKGRRP